jgi:GT2 family glycosyltransferase
LKPGSQTLGADQYEVIISDDGHGYPAEPFCRENYPWVRYTHGPQRGPAANRNNGANLAKGEWLVFTDDDCLPEPGWLQAYADALQQYPACKAFEGAILPDDWELLKKDMAECPVNTEGGCFWSANITISAELFRTVKGFDEQFKIAAQEDQDIFLQLKKHTCIPFHSNAVVVHPVRINTLVNLLKQAKGRSENYMIYALKNAGSLGFRDMVDILWKGGVKAQAFAAVHSIGRMNVKHAFLSLYTMMIIYMPKLILEKLK